MDTPFACRPGFSFADVGVFLRADGFAMAFPRNRLDRRALVDVMASDDEGVTDDIF